MTLERKCFAQKPDSKDWIEAPLFDNDRVVIASFTESNPSDRSYLTVSENGRLQTTTMRSDATVFVLTTTTGEPDAIRELNEFTLRAEPIPQKDTKKPKTVSEQGGIVHLVFENQSFQIFPDENLPSRQKAGPIRFIPSRVTQDRLDRKLTKSTPIPKDKFQQQSPFFGNESDLVRYGETVLLRVPSQEVSSMSNYEFMQCTKNGNEPNCRLPFFELRQALDKNPNVTSVSDWTNSYNSQAKNEHRFFMFQCPEKNLMYAKFAKQKEVVSKHEMAEPVDNENESSISKEVAAVAAAAAVANGSNLANNVPQGTPHVANSLEKKDITTVAKPTLAAPTVAEDLKSAEKGQDWTWLWILIAVLVVIFIAVIVGLVVSYKNKTFPFKTT